MFCIGAINYILTFDAKFKNNNANYQSFQRNIFLYFSLQRKSNSKILQGKYVKMCN